MVFLFDLACLITSQGPHFSYTKGIRISRKISGNICVSNVSDVVNFLFQTDDQPGRDTDNLLYLATH